MKTLAKKKKATSVNTAAKKKVAVKKALVKRTPAQTAVAKKAAGKKAVMKTSAAKKSGTVKTTPPKAAPPITTSPEAASHPGNSPSALIDARIQELGDWRGTTLSRIRTLIKEVAPGVTEEWKWRGVPVWYQDGMICTGETYKDVVKTTFAKGAALQDPAGLFNSSLDGNVRRAIDFREGEEINVEALKSLIRAAVELNQSKGRK